MQPAAHVAEPQHHGVEVPAVDAEAAPTAQAILIAISP